ncbi:MAG: stage II sporulation protein M [bacterium]|jgi:stage II sporulation protein M
MYRRGQVREFFQEYLRENLGVYLFVILLFLMGIIFGALAVKALNSQQKTELFSYLEVFIQGMNPLLAKTDSLLHNSIIDNLQTIGLIWCFGLIVIGLPLVLVMVFTKGFALGFTVGFLVYEIGFKGVFFSIASVLPPSLFLIPALVVMSVAAISFSLAIIRSRLLRHNVHVYPQQVFGYSCLALLAAGMGILASLVEIYISPVFIGLVSKWVF